MEDEKKQADDWEARKAFTEEIQFSQKVIVWIDTVKELLVCTLTRVAKEVLH